MSKFLDTTGVTYLWNKAKAFFATKAHTHKVADISDLSTSLNDKVPTTRKVNGKALSVDITLSAADVSAIPTSQKGVPSGVAELDGAGKVLSSQLPSYVDDTVEGYLNGSKFYKDSGHEEEINGEAGKIYVDLATNKTYRWSSTTFVEISASLALGTTPNTAFRGDQGQTAYEHANARGEAFPAGLYKITTNEQGHVIEATEVAKEDITTLGIPGTIKAVAGPKVDSVGTPTVTVSTLGDITTLTFNYLKGVQGEKGNPGAKGDPGSYTIGAGLALGGSTLSVKTDGAISGQTYPVKTDSSGNLVVNVPWTDKDTTYTAMASAEISTGTATTARTISAKVLNDWIGTKIGTSIEAITEEEIDAICV